MNYQDKQLICRDCRHKFNWSAGEQEFFAKKALKNPPSRCPKCRELFKQKKESGDLNADIRCSKCGVEDKVPFAPRHPKGVMCEQCFKGFLKSLPKKSL
jgi:CxxC-x17-CxxC domain-containing protein